MRRTRCCARSRRAGRCCADGNGGWSGWIDEFGTIRTTLVDDRGSIYFRGTQTVNVTRDARWIGRNSFYVEHGDWFVGVSAALALFGFALLRVGVPSAGRRLGRGRWPRRQPVARLQTRDVPAYRKPVRDDFSHHGSGDPCHGAGSEPYNFGGFSASAGFFGPQPQHAPRSRPRPPAMQLRQPGRSEQAGRRRT